MEKVFYVVFCKAECLPRYLTLLDKNISHCFTLEKLRVENYIYYLKVENLTNIIETGIYFDEIVDILPNSIRVIEMKVDIFYKRPMTQCMIIECVSVTKKLLGINKPFILTPKQLMTYLLKSGGREIEFK